VAEATTHKSSYFFRSLFVFDFGELQQSGTQWWYVLAQNLDRQIQTLTG
jgi:hypothetical protein